MWNWTNGYHPDEETLEVNLSIKRETAKRSESEVTKTIKAEHLILNWFESTGTLQLQGSQATAYKAILNQLLTRKPQFPPNWRHKRFYCTRENRSLVSQRPQTGATSRSSCIDVYVCKRTRQIWTEIKSLHNRFAKIDEPSEGDVNNIQLINTLRQENKDLSQEICMLKVRLQEDNNMLNKIIEERDSYKKALQIMTKEINTANTIREEQQQQQPPPSLHEEAHQELNIMMFNTMKLQASMAVKLKVSRENRMKWGALQSRS